MSGRVPRASERLVGGAVRDHTGSWSFGRAGPHTNGGCRHTRRVVIRELLARCIRRFHRRTDKMAPSSGPDTTSTMAGRASLARHVGCRLPGWRTKPRLPMVNATRANGRATRAKSVAMERRTSTTWRNSLVRTPCARGDLVPPQPIVVNHFVGFEPDELGRWLRLRRSAIARRLVRTRSRLLKQGVDLRVEPNKKSGLPTNKKN